jgi:NADPH2:quinone reductase
MMKAVGYWTKGLATSDPKSLQDIVLPDPKAPARRDLLVRVHAVSVNPRDVKSRFSIESDSEQPVVLGYDASGVVEAVGPEVELFRPGDAVFYAGVLDRQGSNAELQLVDERIVGLKPSAIDYAAAASLPLTSLTAWEMLFDRLQLPLDGGAGEALLVIGGAGGVPSMALQFARQLSRVEVVATASRPKSEAWVRSLGAQYVIDHSCPIAEQVERIENLAPVSRIFSTHTNAKSWAEMAKIISPQGRIGLIDDPEPLDLRLMKFKSVSIHWEAMFTRPMFATADIERQHGILNAVAKLVDDGKIRPPTTTDYGTINAENLRRAHETIETGYMIGKITLSGFE